MEGPVPELRGRDGHARVLDLGEDLDRIPLARGRGRVRPRALRLDVVPDVQVVDTEGEPLGDEAVGRGCGVAEDALRGVGAGRVHDPHRAPQADDVLPVQRVDVPVLPLENQPRLGLGDDLHVVERRRCRDRLGLAVDGGLERRPDGREPRRERRHREDLVQSRRGPRRVRSAEVVALEPVASRVVGRDVCPRERGGVEGDVLDEAREALRGTGRAADENPGEISQVHYVPGPDRVNCPVDVEQGEVSVVGDDDVVQTPVE